MNIISIGASASRTFQNAISVVSHNIANASTIGYHSQKVSFKELPDRQGVQIDNIKRNYNKFIESANQEISSKYSFYNSLENSSQKIAINLYLDNFEDSIQKTIQNPSSIISRQSIIDQATQFSSDFNNTLDNIQSSKSQTNQEISIDIDHVNNILENLAKPSTPDQQNNSLKELSKYISFRSIDTSSGINIYLDPKGTSLLLGDKVSKLSFDNQTIQLNNQSIEQDFSSGSLKGQLEFKNNLKNLDSELKQFGSSFSENVNNQLTQGKDLNGDQGTSLFQTNLSGHLEVSIQDPKLLAVADSLGGVGNNENFKKINLQFSRDNLSNIKTKLNSQTQNIQNQKNIYSNLLDRSNQEISSYSEVNLEEELVSLMQYKQSFEASAKIIQVGSEIFDTLLNSLKR